jgi:hypothetical protein
MVGYFVIWWSNIYNSLMLFNLKFGLLICVVSCRTMSLVVQLQ